MSKISDVSVLLILLTAGPSSATGGTITYQVIDLGSAKYPDVAAQGLNNAGQVTGFSQTSNGFFASGFLWSGGVLADLGLGPSNSFALGINDSGEIVGQSRNNAFLWSAGTVTNLAPGNALSRAYGINNSGQVVGIVENRAVLWSGGVTTDLGLANSIAWAINGTGQIVGETQGSPFVWNSGVVTRIGPLGANGVAYDINDSGQVVGTISGGGTQSAFLWSGGVLTDLGTLGGPFSEAFRINSSGQIVGTSETSSGASHAFLWSGGVMVDLNTLIDPALGVTLSTDGGINDAGQIAALGTYKNGQMASFLLTPTVPEPSTLALAFVTLFLLVVVHRRRLGATAG